MLSDTNSNILPEHRVSSKMAEASITCFPNQFNQYMSMKKTFTKLFDVIKSAPTALQRVNAILSYPVFRSTRGLAIKTVLLLAFVSLNLDALAQGITIKGKVSDKTGGIPGATVTVKGTKIVTSTNTSGDYSIIVPNKTAVLVFTFIGLETKEVPILGKSTVNITLAESSSSLNEVVVIGYGSVKRKDLTGAVGSVNMTDVEKAPVLSLDQAMQGRLAGVQVTSSDGQPGANADFVIRGVGSVSQTAAPLFVIDGFPQEDFNFNSLSPQDIASVEVLKDASATAIYGSRGANGVIIITTKRGTSAVPSISYSTNAGFQNTIAKVKMLDSYEFVKLQNDVNPFYTNYVYFSNGKTLDSYRNAPYIDWQDLLSNKNPSFQTHNISIAGKSDKTSYVISGNYANQDGLIIKSGFERYQGRVVIDQNINDYLKVGINANYASTFTYGSIPSVQAQPTGNGQNLSSYNLMNQIWSYRPVASSRANDLYDIVNEPLDNNVDEGGIATNTTINPYINTLNDISNRYSNTLNTNGYAEIQIMPGLKLRSTVGINLINNHNDAFHNSKTQSGSPLTASGKTYGVNGSESNSKAYTFLNENTLSYSKVINKNNKFDALVGYSFQNSNSSSNGFSAYNLPNEAIGINGIGQGTPYTVSSSSSLNALQSVLGRVNYAYKDNYLFTVNFRADGTSKFYKDSRWGYFPSGAFAWKFGQEKFMKKLTWIDDAKLRVSYGVIGNNRVSDFAYLSQLATSTGTSYSINEQTLNGSIVSTISNNNLKWETTYETDLGLDLDLFKSRLSVSIDYYKRITKNLLLQAPIPYSTGFANAFENIGSVSNEGLEFTINTVNTRTKNFTWSSSFNISFNKNRLISLVSGQVAQLSAKSYQSALTNNNYIASVGGPVAAFYGLVYEGNYQYSDFYKIPNGTGYYYVLKEGIPYYSSKNTLAAPVANQANVVQPGDPKYKDINGDGLIDLNDYTTIGSPYPIHFGGFSNNFSYKGFSLNVFFQWSYGNQILDANRMAFEGSTNAPQSGSSITANLGTVNTNMFATYANRWTPTNPSNEYPRANANTTGLRQWSSRIIEDGSYLRLKTVSFGYNLPKHLLTKIRVSNLRLSVSGQNLVTWTKYQGPDPEVSTANGSNLTPGFDFSPYPRTRVYTLGLNLTL